MKQLRYILIVIGVLSVVAVSAATFGAPYTPNHVSYQPMQSQGVQMPTAAMRSTSAMRYSGSALPMAAATGVSTTCNNQGGPRRAKKGNPFEEETGGEAETIAGSGTSTPLEPGLPIGDAVLPLMLMAMLFAGVIAVRKKRVVKVNG